MNDKSKEQIRHEFKRYYNSVMAKTTYKNNKKK